MLFYEFARIFNINSTEQIVDTSVVSYARKRFCSAMIFCIHK